MILEDCTAWADEHDLSCKATRARWAATRTAEDATTFCSAGWRESEAGIAQAEIDLDTLFDATIDQELWDQLSGTDLSAVLTLTIDGTDGAAAYMFAGAAVSYDPLANGRVGSVRRASTKWQASAVAGGAGYLLLPKAARTAGTANGTARELGAISAGEQLVWVIHVFSITGSVDIDIASSTTSGGSYTVRGSQNSITAAGAYLLSDDTARTDTWWRIQYDLTTGPATFAVAAAVAPA